jgi:hypothetical protein
MKRFFFTTRASALLFIIAVLGIVVVLPQQQVKAANGETRPRRSDRARRAPRTPSEGAVSVTIHLTTPLAASMNTQRAEFLKIKGVVGVSLRVHELTFRLASGADPALVTTNAKNIIAHLRAVPERPNAAAAKCRDAKAQARLRSQALRRLSRIRHEMNKLNALLNRR